MATCGDVFWSLFRLTIYVAGFYYGHEYYGNWGLLYALIAIYVLFLIWSIILRICGLKEMVAIDCVFQFDKSINRQSIVTHFAMEKFNAIEMKEYIKEKLFEQPRFASTISKVMGMHYWK